MGDRVTKIEHAAQQDDGYLISYFIAKESEDRWTNMRLNHQMYNAGHFFEFAVAHHQLDGGTRALEAAKRFADHIDHIFGPGKRYDVDGHQGLELALVKLYRALVSSATSTSVVFSSRNAPISTVMSGNPSLTCDPGPCPSASRRRR